MVCAFMCNFKYYFITIKVSPLSITATSARLRTVSTLLVWLPFAHGRRLHVLIHHKNQLQSCVIAKLVNTSLLRKNTSKSKWNTNILCNSLKKINSSEWNLTIKSRTTTIRYISKYTKILSNHVHALKLDSEIIQMWWIIFIRNRKRPRYLQWHALPQHNCSCYKIQRHPTTQVNKLAIVNHIEANIESITTAR